MTIQRNFLVKVKEAALKDVNKALKDAGIETVSVMEIFKEELDTEKAETGETGSGKEKA